MPAQVIKIIGARQHNLKNLSVEIPREKLVVITGLSGSGKSSLAFDTLYAEGQRRYVESLSAYARQFLGQMEKPEVDSIDGTVIKAQTAEGIVGTLLSFPEGAKLQVLAPVVKDRKGEYRKNFADYKAQGFSRVRVDGKLGTVDDEWKLARY